MALPDLPQESAEQIARMKRYYETMGRCLCCAMIDKEIAHRERLVSNRRPIRRLLSVRSRASPTKPGFCPETMRRFSNTARRRTSSALARILRDTLARLNATLGKPPFNYVIHTAPDRRGIQPRFITGNCRFCRN
jgi:UDPglucose--hexose-1-phosphate uridylyltransferase